MMLTSFILPTFGKYREKASQAMAAMSPPEFMAGAFRFPSLPLPHYILDGRVNVIGVSTEISLERHN